MVKNSKSPILMLHLTGEFWKVGVGQSLSHLTTELKCLTHTANYLVTQYKFLFLPSWETQQMVKNAMVSFDENSQTDDNFKSLSF